MNTDDCLRINRERLKGWGDRLAQENATPILLIGLRPGEASGDVVLCITDEGPTREQIIGLLRHLADRLENTA